MKAVILARGLGTRMKAQDEAAALSAEQRAVADTGVKALVPLTDRPFLDYILSSLADAGCTKICLVIGPEHDALRDRYTKHVPPTRFEVRFAIQEKPLGTGNAVLAAEAFAAGDEFLMANSDNYYPLDVLRTLVEMGRPGTVSLLARGTRGAFEHRAREDPRVRARADRRDGCLDALVEKPDAAALASFGTERHVSMNCWRFPSSIFDHCRALTPSVRGELELTDAITASIASGVRYKVLTSEKGVLDLSRRGDIDAVRRSLEGVKVAL